MQSENWNSWKKAFLLNLKFVFWLFKCLFNILINPLHVFFSFSFLFLVLFLLFNFESFLGNTRKEKFQFWIKWIYFFSSARSKRCSSFFVNWSWWNLWSILISLSVVTRLFIFLVGFFWDVFSIFLKSFVFGRQYWNKKERKDLSMTEVQTLLLLFYFFYFYCIKLWSNLFSFLFYCWIKPK